MKMSRRDFLKAAGCSALALFAAEPLLSTSAAATRVEGKGKRLALVIDLAGCGKKESCRDCIDACHRVHNVPHFNNGKDEIKWIWSVPFDEVFPDQALTRAKDRPLGAAINPEKSPALVLCNHCDNPPCVSVCPTKATFKRADGLVMMDYHRCIGCRYCMAACPYGARSFNWRDPKPVLRTVDPSYPTRTKGVVEKCNFCDERLSKGLQPACVEACKDKKLTFGDMNDPTSLVRKALEGRVVLRRKPGLGTRPSVYYIIV
jgi:molybdopterin-containing oxidoreductase family iron-sulfur binding subunit